MNMDEVIQLKITSGNLSDNNCFVRGADEILGTYVLLTWAQTCQGPQFLRDMGMTRPSSGPAQGNGKAFPWLMRKMLTTASSSWVFSGSYFSATKISTKIS